MQTLLTFIFRIRFSSCVPVYGLRLCLLVLCAPVLWSCLDLKSIVCGLSHGTSSAIAIAIAIAIANAVLQLKADHKKSFLAMGELGVIVLHLHPSDKWHEHWAINVDQREYSRLFLSDCFSCLVFEFCPWPNHRHCFVSEFASDRMSVNLPHS